MVKAWLDAVQLQQVAVLLSHIPGRWEHKYTNTKNTQIQNKQIQKIHKYKYTNTKNTQNKIRKYMKQVVVALSRIPGRWEDKYWTGMQLVKFFFSFIVSWSSGDIWEIWATCCLLKGDSRVFCAGRTYLSFAPMIILMSSAFREDRASSLLVGQNPCVSKQSCSECMQVRRTESKQAN